jgi:hypothetical protein
MSKARASSTIVLLLGLSALLLFGQLSPLNNDGPNANAERGEMSTQTNVTKIIEIFNVYSYCTVMFFCNPTLTNAKVKIQTYGYDGSPLESMTFTVPKKGLVRASDATIWGGPHGSGWDNAIKLPWTTSATTWAKFTYPSTLKVTAYTASQNSSNTLYDPSILLPIVPLPVL